MTNLIKFSDAVSIGLHAMVYIASQPKRLVNIKEIAESLEVSVNHLSKIMQRLQKEGLVHGLRGPSGGYALEKYAHEIVLLDVITAIDGPVRVKKCMFDRPICCEKFCEMGELIGDMQMKLKTYLSETTLSQFMSNVSLNTKTPQIGGKL